jgi:hypothetical protein
MCHWPGYPSVGRHGAAVGNVGKQSDAVTGGRGGDSHGSEGCCAGRDPRMSGNCDLRRGLRRREKNATKAGAGHFEKPAPDARAAPPEAHESLIGPKTVEVVPLTGLSFLPSRALHARATGMAVTLRAVGIPGLSGTGGASGPSRPSLKPKKYPRHT